MYKIDPEFLRTRTFAELPPEAYKLCFVLLAFQKGGRLPAASVCRARLSAKTQTWDALFLNGMLRDEGECVSFGPWVRFDDSSSRSRKSREKAKKAEALPVALHAVVNAPQNATAAPLPVAPAQRCPPCQYEALKALFEERCESLPRVALLTELRKKAMSARWNAVWNLNRQRDGNDLLDFFAAYFDKVEASDFLSGRSEAWGTWRGPNIDWIFNAQNFAKILEDKYDNA